MAAALDVSLSRVWRLENGVCEPRSTELVRLREMLEERGDAVAALGDTAELILGAEARRRLAAELDRCSKGQAGAKSERDRLALARSPAEPQHRGA